MHVILWIGQGLLALAFLGAGAMKLTRRRAQLEQSGLAWVAHYSDSQVRLIGLAEVVGAIGLVVPWALRIAPILTPVAAACLAAVMVGAIVEHLAHNDAGHAAPAVVLFILLVLVAIGRFANAA